MSHDRRGFLGAGVLLALALGVAGNTVAQDKLKKGDKKWMEEEVGAIITQQEINTFEQISEKDRKLFKELFWARRDPDPRTPKNELRNSFEARVKQADQTFQQRGHKGSQTDMGKIFVLLGPPQQRERGRGRGGSIDDAGNVPGGRGGGDPNWAEDPTGGGGPPGGGGFGTGQRGGGANVVTWVYDANPRAGIPDGLSLQFRQVAGFGFRIVGMDELRESLDRVKTRWIANPAIDYARDEEGRLRELDDVFNPNSPAKQILHALRDTQKESPDIPLDARFAFFAATSKDTYIPILLDLHATPFTWKGGEADATAFFSVEDIDGFELVQQVVKTSLTKTTDERATLELPTELPSGQYTIYLGIRDNASEKFGTRILDLEVPNFGSGELKLSSVLLFTDGEKLQEFVPKTGQAFLVGGFHFYPKLGKTYETSDALRAVFNVYGYGLENGNPDLTMQFVFSKDGRRRGQTKDEPIQSASEAIAIGVMDVPLASFEPGDYTVQLRVTDHVKDEVVTEDIDFVIEGAEGTR